MKTSAIVALVLLLGGAGCGPLIELEDENVALKAQVDSLEIALAECGTQTDLAHERLAAIERENLQLDDRNRQLAALVAELRHETTADAGVTASSPDAGEPDAQARRTASAVAETQLPAATSSAAGDAPAFDPAVQPSMTFLREYQKGLSAYHAREFDRARRLFAGLLQTGGANDMTDNCVYWLGETALQQGQYAEARDLFSTVLGYGNSDKMPHALLARARAAVAQKRHGDARRDCDVLLRDYPGSEQAAPARKLLKDLP